MGEFLIVALLAGALGIFAPETPKGEVLRTVVLEETGAVGFFHAHSHPNVMRHRVEGEYIVICPNKKKVWVSANMTAWGTINIKPKKVCSQSQDQK
jgi:hypothetical protein